MRRGDKHSIAITFVEFSLSISLSVSLSITLNNELVSSFFLQGETVTWMATFGTDSTPLPTSLLPVHHTTQQYKTQYYSIKTILLYYIEYIDIFY